MEEGGYLFAKRLAPARLWGLAGLAALAFSSLALADPAPETSRTCEAIGAAEAQAHADAHFQKGEYQQAGVCYEAAGDMTHANLAFLKAAGPRGEESAQALKKQAQQAKELVASVQRAFRSNH